MLRPGLVIQYTEMKTRIHGKENLLLEIIYPESYRIDQKKQTRPIQSAAAHVRNHPIVQTGRSSAKSYQFESGSPFSSSQSIQLMGTAGYRILFFPSCKEPAGKIPAGRVTGEGSIRATPGHHQ